jgi:beta-lactamase regulating signal transducer with metallopeptidase domain
MHWRRIRIVLQTAKPLSLETPIPAMTAPSLLEPGVFGIWKPVLLLPEGITAHLTPEHLVTIVAHELSHVRRRDNLAAAAHMWFRRCSGFTRKAS